MMLVRRMALGLLAAAAGGALAQDAPPRKLVDTIAPTGPVTARVDLAAEFPQMKGYVLQQSFNTVPPGSGRAWHSHAGSPEIVRVLAGTLTEQHDAEPPKDYGPGSTLVNAAGRQHMWANRGTVPVVFVATSIRAAQ